mmetsp:Transcript_158839/g.509261  ORF Transcript_158839/g.509261 Transcript_158839/m.509261 type:complete len:442 (+) Transcript_158839:221-1546(+)
MTPLHLAVGVQSLALPPLRKAFRLCGIVGSESWHLLRSLVNESGHLHWSAKNLGWLRGDIYGEGFVPALEAFVADRAAGDPRVLQLGCEIYIDRSYTFYAAWHDLLAALRLGAEAAGRRSLRNGLVHYVNYLMTKSPSEDVLPQEKQFAFLFRSVQAIRTGSEQHQCACQLFWGAKLAASRKLFDSLFRFDHIHPGPLGEPSRDDFLGHLLWSADCDWRMGEGLVKWGVDLEQLMAPDQDQIRSSWACLPMRILASLVCGQVALLHARLDAARASFDAAQRMMMFALDCFDSSVFGSPRLFDLFAYLARLDPSVNPHPQMRLESVAGWRQPRRDRAVFVDVATSAAPLPALCLDRRGGISLRIDGLPGSEHYLYDMTGAWSLVPVRVPLQSESQPIAATVALFLSVDNASWQNLGHALAFLAPQVFAAFSKVYARHGPQAS